MSVALMRVDKWVHRDFAALFFRFPAHLQFPIVVSFQVSRLIFLGFVCLLLA